MKMTSLFHLRGCSPFNLVVSSLHRMDATMLLPPLRRKIRKCRPNNSLCLCVPLNLQVYLLSRRKGGYCRSRKPPFSMSLILRLLNYGRTIGCTCIFSHLFFDAPSLVVPTVVQYGSESRRCALLVLQYYISNLSCQHTCRLHKQDYPENGLSSGERWLCPKPFLWGTLGRRCQFFELPSCSKQHSKVWSCPYLWHTRILIVSLLSIPTHRTLSILVALSTLASLEITSNVREGI